MKELILRINNNRIIHNPNFWVILIIVIALNFIYTAWPWRDWQLVEGMSRWFPWISSFNSLVLLEMEYRIIGILFFVPIIYAAIIFSWQGALIVFLASLISVLPIIVGMWDIKYIVTNMILLMTPFFVMSIASLEFAWRRKERRFFIEREADRQFYIANILKSVENERQRIAQDLHDETIQNLLLITKKTTPIPVMEVNLANIKDINQRLEWIRESNLQVIEDLRRTVLNLRPLILDEIGLVPAAKLLLGRMKIESSINAHFNVNGEEYEINSHAEIILFRVIQEALHNIERHSRAKDATITMNFTPDSLKIIIQDNGKGFVMPDDIQVLFDKGKLGISGMKQRIALLDGFFKIVSSPGEGTVIQITVSKNSIHGSK